jgi:hypothetical protein
VRPERQLNVAVDEYVVVGALALPLTGVPGGPKSTATQVGAVPLQVPSGWHVRVGAPTMS